MTGGVVTACMHGVVDADVDVGAVLEVDVDVVDERLGRCWRSR